MEIPWMARENGRVEREKQSSLEMGINKKQVLPPSPIAANGRVQGLSALQVAATTGLVRNVVPIMGQVLGRARWSNESPSHLCAGQPGRFTASSAICAGSLPYSSRPVEPREEGGV
jgi:hypothetical protein